jgi:hypothetical protein
VIAFLREENRVLKAQLGNRRLRLDDDQRHRLGVLGHRLGRRVLDEVATLVTPDTISDGAERWWPGSGPTPGSDPADPAYDAKSDVW